MAGYNLINQIDNMRAKCAEMGLKITGTKYHYNGLDYLAVRPDGDSWPIYSRDTELFVGTLHELEIWIKGMEEMKDYLCVIKATNENLIAKKEQDIRNKHLLETLKNSGDTSAKSG